MRRKVLTAGKFTLFAFLLLARFTPTGRLDPAFGDHGITQGKRPDNVFYPGNISLAMQRDGKLVITTPSSPLERFLG